MKIDTSLQPADLGKSLETMWTASAAKIKDLEENYPADAGAPVYTVQGKYTSRGWTEWTQGFQYGGAILQFDATGDEEFLELGRQRTVDRMSGHITHVGVHDHGFNNVSTYGNLWRLMGEGRIPENIWEQNFYELALKCSGAVQASRWTTIKDGSGYICSFNGPHSLFSDTIRSCRALSLGHLLGQKLSGEADAQISLLDRMLQHARNTALYNVYYGEGRDAYDLRGRVVHESIFNVNDGNYRCPSTQQGYSPFSTWTRGLAWVLCGYPEELEFLAVLPDSELAPFGGRKEVEEWMLKAALAAADFYIDNTAADGVPYWDTGAPGLRDLGEDYLEKPSDPFNDHEPVDSSAAAISAQGLLRLGHYLRAQGRTEEGDRYWQAGLTTSRALLTEPYLSTDPKHQGLLLHSVYHRPNGWDYVPPGQKVMCGEACMWGDYHLRELGLYLHRTITNETYPTFFGAKS